MIKIKKMSKLNQVKVFYYHGYYEDKDEGCFQRIEAGYKCSDGIVNQRVFNFPFEKMFSENKIKIFLKTEIPFLKNSRVKMISKNCTGGNIPICIYAM